MSARAWKRRRAKAAVREAEGVTNIADQRARAERQAFNNALAWWLDRPHLTYGGEP